MWRCWETTCGRGSRTSGCLRCALLCTAPTLVSSASLLAAVRCQIQPRSKWGCIQLDQIGKDLLHEACVAAWYCKLMSNVLCTSPGNPGKPLGFSLNWSARITSEFFAQVCCMNCAIHPLPPATWHMHSPGPLADLTRCRRAMLRRLPGCLYPAGATERQQTSLRHRYFAATPVSAAHVAHHALDCPGPRLPLWQGTVAG